jgi:hypothetical protein
VFLLAAGMVSYLVDLAARRREELARVRAEAKAMARMAGSLAEEELLPRMVEQLRTPSASRAQRCSESMGGELVIEDTPGGGTTMIVILPQHQRHTG